MTPSVHSRFSNYSARNNHGNPHNPDALIEKNRGLVLSAVGPLIRRYGSGVLSEADKQDIEAAGYLGLCLAAKRYDPGKGAAFSTFAWLCIQGTAKKALSRRGEAKARAAGVTVGSLDAPIALGENVIPLIDVVKDPDGEAPFDAIADGAFDEAARARLWAWITPCLTEKQARAVWLHFGEGKSAPEIAELCGTSSSNVSSLLKAAMQRLKRAAEKPPARGVRRLFGAE